LIVFYEDQGVQHTQEPWLYEKVFTECPAIQEVTAAIKDNLTDHHSKEAIQTLLLIHLQVLMAHLVHHPNKEVLHILLVVLMAHQVDQRNNTPQHLLPIDQLLALMVPLLFHLSSITQEDIHHHYNKEEDLHPRQDLQDLQPMMELDYLPLTLLTTIKRRNYHQGEIILRRLVLILNRVTLLKMLHRKAMFLLQQLLDIPLLCIKHLVLRTRPILPRDIHNTVVLLLLALATNRIGLLHLPGSSNKTQVWFLHVPDGKKPYSLESIILAQQQH
jgi:hypothetical protein